MHKWHGKRLGQKVVVHSPPPEMQNYMGMVGRIVGFTHQPQNAGINEYGIDVEFTEPSGLLYSAMFYNRHIKKAAE